MEQYHHGVPPIQHRLHSIEWLLMWCCQPLFQLEERCWILDCRYQRCGKSVSLIGPLFNGPMRSFLKPCITAAHLQAILYAVAERAAKLIAADKD